MARVHGLLGRKKWTECAQVLEAGGHERRTDSAMFRMTSRQPSAEPVWTEANIGRQLSFNNYLSTQ